MEIKPLFASLGGLAAMACSSPEAGDNTKAFLSLEDNPKDPVNVILVNLDDSGLADFSYNGALGYSTPNVDRLASEGVVFTNYYSAQPISGASRAALMTGCYSNRIGLVMAPFPGSATGISDDEQTIGNLLQDNGYSTCIVGKWHLGDNEQFLPLEHGFDEYFGLPYSNDMWTGNERAVMKHPPLPLYKGKEVHKYIMTMEDMSELTTSYTEYSIDFITRNAGQKKPFFLYLAHNMPHVPLAVSDKFKGKSGTGLYGDVMMELDWSIGQIYQTLEDLGIAENTLIIITSDNGPWLNYGNHAGSTGGLREGKSTTFNGGLRVPCFMYMKGHTASGRICNDLMSSIDILPTVASLTGSEMPRNKIDGIDFLPYLTGKTEEPAREYLCFYFNRNSLEGITDGRYKLIFPHRYQSYEVNAPGNDGVRGATAMREVLQEELYDIAHDAGERNNLYEQLPEVVAKLEAAADAMRADLGDDLRGIAPTGAREPGRLVRQVPAN